MAVENQLDRITDPVEMLNLVLEQIWEKLCNNYCATACLPEIQTLFDGADLNQPYQAAKMVLANMLLEVSESVGRFSPWYTRPARAYGLISLRDIKSGKNRWMLAPEAVQKWQFTLDHLCTVIDKSYVVLRAMIFMDALMEEAQDARQPALVTTTCGCNPPRRIQLSLKEMERGEVRCEMCSQLFR